MTSKQERFALLRDDFEWPFGGVAVPVSWLTKGGLDAAQDRDSSHAVLVSRDDADRADGVSVFTAGMELSTMDSYHHVVNTLYTLLDAGYIDEEKAMTALGKGDKACPACGHTAESLRAAMGPVYADDPECNDWQCNDEWCYGIGKEPSSD